MNPTEEDIKEIAELLESGELCFFHEPTGTIEHHPDPDNPYADLDEWQETIDKIEADLTNFKRFEKMDSRQGFRVMENFANSITDENFRAQLFKFLSARKPFSKFKWAVDNSKFRQDWFDFKAQANIDWVQKQIG